MTPKAKAHLELVPAYASPILLEMDGHVKR